MLIVEDRVGMETFKKFVGAIEETGWIHQEDVRGVDGGIGMAPLKGGNDDMVTHSFDVEGKYASYTTVGEKNYNGKKV